MRAVLAVGDVLFFGRADHDAVVLRSRVIEEFHAQKSGFIRLGHFEGWELVSGDGCLAVSRNVRDESRP
jgi:hypothetical protein